MFYSSLKSHRGFTLIELMVVVAIIAMMSGMVLFSVGANGEAKKLRALAEKLHATIRYAGQEAMLSGEEYGLVFYRDGYRFLQWDEVPPPPPQVAAPSTILSDEDEEQQRSQWRLNQSDGFVSEVKIGTDIIINLTLEEEVLDLEPLADNPIKKESESLDIGFDNKPLLPMILLLSTGEASSFELELASAENSELRYIVTGDLVGNLKIIRPGEQQ